MILCNGDKCYGCRICENICPVKAISFVANSKGFKYPVIDEEKCVHCGLCEKYCALTNRAIEKNVPLEYFAVKSKDKLIKKNSSSGGVFFLLAKKVISQGGVVYGCLMDDNIEAVHGRADTIEGCVPFLGSKYVQSDMQDTILHILDDLKAGREVLFSGTPCQCMGVKNIVSHISYRGKLTLCDFYCHGVPSPKVFNDFKRYMEEKHEGIIESLVFRDKERVVNPPSSRGIRMKIRCEGQVRDIYNPNDNDMYFELFKFCYTLRDSCFDCPCLGSERYSDITIGDYWGCEKYHPEFYDTEGISVISINSCVGKSLYDSIKPDIEYISIHEDEITQPMLKCGPQKKANYDEVWKIYYSKGFVEAAHTAMKTNRIGIRTKVLIKIKDILSEDLISQLRKVKLQIQRKH